MNKGINYRKGKRREIIMLLLACGIIPYKSLALWGDGARLMMRKAREMSEDGTVEINKREHQKFVTLANFSVKSKEYIPYMPNGYEEHYLNNIAYIRKHALYKDTPKIKFERAIRTSEIFILMYLSGARVFFDEKPPLANLNDLIKGDDVTYYTGPEIKDYKNDGLKKISVDGQTQLGNTRVIGAMFSPGGVYSIYNIGSKLIEWKRYGEVKIATHINRLAEEQYEPFRFHNEEEIPKVDSAIFYAYDEKIFVRVINNEYQDKKKSGNILLNIDMTYKHMYALPLNDMGLYMTKIMQCKNWQNIMRHMFFDQGENLDTRTFDVACDAYDERSNTYILLFCIPDLSKLKIFIKRAGLEENRGRFRIYCFEEQLPIIAPTVSVGNEKIADVLSIPFTEFYKEWRQIQDEFI